MLINSYNKLKAQNPSNYNLLLINNSEGLYSSAAKAFNKEISDHIEALGEVLVFLHQDIAFDDTSFFNRLEKEFSVNHNLIIGAAGTKEACAVYSNLKYRKSKSFITRHQISTSEMMEVCCVDECCYAIWKDLFLKVRFDETTCNHWHLYGSDLCYSAKRLYNTRVAVIPEIIYHKDSEGGLGVDIHFLNSMWKMVRKYHNDYPILYTTCYTVSTNYLLAFFRLLRSGIGFFLRKLIADYK